MNHNGEQIIRKNTKWIKPNHVHQQPRPPMILRQLVAGNIERKFPRRLQNRHAANKMITASATRGDRPPAWIMSWSSFFCGGKTCFSQSCAIQTHTHTHTHTHKDSDTDIHTYINTYIHTHTRRTEPSKVMEILCRWPRQQTGRKTSGPT